MFSKELEKFLELNKDKKIVFTNGCFDILHRGHISYLNEARAQGDVLVLGLNSDASVKRLKGPTRPVNSEQDRKFVMENLRAIDFVEIFTEDTPFNLIQNISPAVLVKGGDWKPDQIIGSDIVLAAGGEVKSLNFIDGFSTTSTIEKIQTNN
jgi:rfaE bifunctional protein nucleotidyltransferase chain/domain